MQFNSQVTRLLHNFVAATKSLVEHTRIHVRDRYAGTEFEKSTKHI